MDEIQVGVSIETLKILQQVVTASTIRGAIKPEELTIVGKAYDQLTTFLNAVDEREKLINQEQVVETQETV